MRKPIVIAITAALPVLAIAGYAAASGSGSTSRGTSCGQPTGSTAIPDAAKAAVSTARVRTALGTGSSPAASRTPGRRWLPLFNKALIDHWVVDVSAGGLVYALASTRGIKPS